MVRRVWLYILYLIVLVIAMYMWFTIVAPNLTKIPDNFTYTANILSLDNFYNDEAKKFEGEQISKTFFNYSVQAVMPTYLIIKNTFDVRKINDTPIFSVTRYYDINPYTGEHIIISGHEKRFGYLFAPKFLLKNDFYYWHVNYNAPALMKFIDDDTINGLTVYHYQAKYTADQSENLAYLPDVPNKKGIKTFVELNAWFEPVSGWLVKYQDNTMAYYYDRLTGKLLSPWNKFSNRYTAQSAIQQADAAFYLKWKIILIDIGIPLIFVIIFFLFFLSDYLHTNRPYLFIWFDNNISIRLKSIDFTHYISAILMLFLIGSFYYVYTYQAQPANYVIGISTWNSNPSMQEAVKGFKDGLAEYGYIEGKNIKFDIQNPNSNIENQVHIIQNFVRSRVDLIFTLTTPGTLVAKGIVKAIPVVFSDVTFPDVSNITSLNKQKKCNFVGSRNYILPAEQYYDFDKLFSNAKTIGFVHRKGDIDSSLLFQEYKQMLNNRGVNVVEIAAIDLDDLQKQLQQPITYNALFLACDTLIEGGGSKIVADFSRANKIPSFSCAKESVENGALVGYVADLYTIGKIAGRKAALILRGADPDWLQTEPPERGYLIVNSVTARLLGITIPAEMLKHADDVIDNH